MNNYSEHEENLEVEQFLQELVGMRIVEIHLVKVNHGMLLVQKLLDSENDGRFFQISTQRSELMSPHIDEITEADYLKLIKPQAVQGPNMAQTRYAVDEKQYQDKAERWPPYCSDDHSSSESDNDCPTETKAWLNSLNTVAYKNTSHV